MHSFCARWDEAFSAPPARSVPVYWRPRALVIVSLRHISSLLCSSARQALSVAIIHPHPTAQRVGDGIALSVCAILHGPKDARACCRYLQSKHVGTQIC